MKLSIRFFISWLFSALTMFLLFYWWHGVFLNDFQRLNFPLTWFVLFAALTYLIFGAGIYVLYESVLMKKIKSFFLRGIVCGVIAGFTLFMIAVIVNISLTKHLSVQHLLMDCFWQITEQTMGALVIVSAKGSSMSRKQNQFKILPAASRLIKKYYQCFTSNFMSRGLTCKNLFVA